MTTLFDIGDEIKVTLEGKIKEYSVSKDGDCYVIELTNIKPQGTRVYLDSNTLARATRIDPHTKEFFEMNANIIGDMEPRKKFCD